MRSKTFTSGKKVSFFAMMALVMSLLLVFAGCSDVTESTPTGSTNVVPSTPAAPTTFEGKLAAEGTDTIELTEDVVVTEALVVNGNKTITGTGKIILNANDNAQWPAANTELVAGCIELSAADVSNLPAVLTVSDGASLTISGSVCIDAENKFNGIVLNGTASLTVSENAKVENGRYANLVVAQNATAKIEGGELMNAGVHNIINYGATTIAAGTVDGAAEAVLFNAGNATQSGGKISGSGAHNVYVSAGKFTMTGGENDLAKKDGVVVAAGASAELNGGTITNCFHGMCNKGTLTAGEILLEECSILNQATGNMTLNKTTVDTCEENALANHGKVVATDFTSIGCDVCAIFNYDGEMELNNLTVEGSRDSNISVPKGKVTINGATLGESKSSTFVVGGGTAIIDNVKLLGASNEKNGFVVTDGVLTATNVTIENIEAHAINVTGGSASFTNIHVSKVAKNVVQQSGGVLYIDGMTVSEIAGSGAYVKNAELTIVNSTLDGVGKDAVKLDTGCTARVENVKISNAKRNGLSVASGSIMTVIKTEITNTTEGKDSIVNKGTINYQELVYDGTVSGDGTMTELEAQA